MFTINVKADVTVHCVDPEARAQLARIERKVEANGRKLDKLIDALPGQATRLDIKVGPVTEQP